MAAKKGRVLLISGRVQGVGYRYFAEQSANLLGIRGWVRNLDDGRVEVHASGTPEQLDDFEARLRKGPRFADVRSVESHDAAVLELSGFQIR